MTKFDFYTKTPSEEEFQAFLRLYFTKRKLNLGSNEDIREEFINVDIMDFDNLDLRLDLSQIRSVFPEGSAKEILLYDVIEHFPFKQVPEILYDIISILEPGGKIIIRVPSLDRLTKALIERKLPVFEVQRLIFGGQKYPTDYHKIGFTGEMLEGYILGAGCSEVIQRIEEPDTYNVTLVALK